MIVEGLKLVTMINSDSPVNLMTRFAERKQGRKIRIWTFSGITALAGLLFIGYHLLGGSDTRKYADSVIAKVTTNDSYRSLSKEVVFLMSDSQRGWLTAQQLDALKKKYVTILFLGKQNAYDTKLINTAKAAISARVNLGSYNLILADINLLLQDPRSKALLSSSDLDKLQKKKRDIEQAVATGRILPASKESEARVKFLEEYIAKAKAQGVTNEQVRNQLMHSLIGSVGIPGTTDEERELALRRAYEIPSAPSTTIKIVGGVEESGVPPSLYPVIEDLERVRASIVERFMQKNIRGPRAAAEIKLIMRDRSIAALLGAGASSEDAERGWRYIAGGIDKNIND